MALRPTRPSIITWRTAVQFLFVALTAFVAVRHQFTKGPDGTPPLDAYCPMGGVVAIYEYFATGTFIRELSPNNFVMLGMLAAMVLVAKSAFCGWVCPFGTVQDWMARLGRTFKPGAAIVPASIDAPARYLKYAVLLVIVVLTATTGQLVFKDWDPFMALLHLGTGHLATSAYVVLGVVLVASLFVDRPWCRYLCPLAPIVGLLGKLSLIKIERDAGACKECGACSTACPMALDVCNATRITSVECNGCLECVAHDPLPDSLPLRAGPGGRRVGWAVFPVTVLVVFFASIAIGRATGNWNERKLPHQRGDGHGREAHAEVPAAVRDASPPQPTLEAAPTESAEPAESTHREPEQVADRPRPGRGTGRSRRAGRDDTSEGAGRGEDREVELADGRLVEVRGYMSFSEIATSAGLSAGELISELGLAGRAQPEDRVGRTMRSEGRSVNEVRDAVRRLLER